MTALSHSAATFGLMSPAFASNPAATASRDLGHVWVRAALGFCSSTVLMVVMVVILAAVAG